MNVLQFYTKSFNKYNVTQCYKRNVIQYYTMLCNVKQNHLI